MTRDSTLSVYDQTYRHYLERLKQRPFEGRTAVLGIEAEGESVVVPYFGQRLRWREEGLTDEVGQRPDFSDCVVVCRYLIMAPAVEPTRTDWAAFRDFPDAGPLTVFWADTVEGPLARHFGGRCDALEAACRRLDGRLPDEAIACDLCRCFTPLPKVPLLLVFNDADADFPAAASVLFQRRADTFLDAESQAILGHALTRRLIAAA